MLVSGLIFDQKYFSTEKCDWQKAGPGEKLGLLTIEVIYIWNGLLFERLATVDHLDYL